MTNAELLDLLREARECVICPFAYRQTMYCACTFCALKNRIDAALAAHRDEGSTEDVVESKTRWWPSHQETVINGACARVWLQDAKTWGWWTFKDHGVRDTGFAKTEAEAKSAAVAAARGMR